MKQFAKIGAAVTMTALASMSAQAATHTFDAVQNSSTVGAASGSGSLSGTAVWDDSAGTVQINVAGTNTIVAYGATAQLTVTITSNFYGNAGSTFTPTSGDTTVTSCQPAGFLCGAATGGGTSSFNSVGGSLTAAGGTLSSFQVNSGASVTTTYDLTPQVSPVPLPAAAWLFGSGLVGLAGVARRRRS